LHSAGKTRFDGNFVNKSELAQQVLGGTARYSPVDFWRINLIAGRSKQNSDNFKGNTFQSRFNTIRDTITLQNDFTLGKHHLLTIGSDYQNDHVNSTGGFDENSRSNWGEFAQYQGSLAKHNIELSIRHDDNEQFGSRVTGGAGWGYAINEKLRLIANFGSAYKAPTFNELYFPNFGDASLRPEESLSFEIGARGNMGWGNWSLTMYETHIKNLIVTAFDIVEERSFPDNIGKARIRGLEAVVSTQIKGWHLNGNLTFLDPENRSPENRPSGVNRGNILPRRSEQSFRLDTYRTFFDKVMLGAMFLAEGERQDNVANTRKLDSYTKFDLRAEYNITKNWRLQGRIENLFDVHYETASFFNQPGRNFFVTIRYQPSS